MPPFQRSELLPEGEIFEEQVAAKTDGSSSQNKQEPQQAEHGASLTRKIRRNPIHLHLSDLAADRNFGEAQAEVLTLAAEDALKWTRWNENNRIVARLRNFPEYKSWLKAVASGIGPEEAAKQYDALVHKASV